MGKLNCCKNNVLISIKIMTSPVVVVGCHVMLSNICL